MDTKSANAEQIITLLQFDSSMTNIFSYKFPQIEEITIRHIGKDKYEITGLKLKEKAKEE